MTKCIFTWIQKSFLSSITILPFLLLIQYKAYAIEFFNGVPTVLTDINKPSDSIYAGSDSTTGPTAILSTKLLLTTQNNSRNVVSQIYGGGLSGSTGQPNTINGDITLTIINTDAQIIHAGGSSQGGLSTVTGSVYLKVMNSNSKGISPGINRTNRTGKGQILGSIYMELDNVTSTIVDCGGRAGGPNNISVYGDVNTTINNSKIEELLLTPFRSSNAATKGNVTVTIKNSSINSVLGTGGSDILGNVFITIGENCQILEVSPVTTGSIHGAVSININKATANTVILGPRLRGTVKNVNLTVSDSTIQDICCSPYNNRDRVLPSGVITINSGNIENLFLGAHIGTTLSATATINGGSINNFIVGSQQTGNTTNAIATINGGFINNLSVGSQDTGHTTNAFVEINSGTIGKLILGGAGTTDSSMASISGGWINTIVTDHADVTAINFIAGDKSFIKESISGPKILDCVAIQKNARTQWGSRNNDFSLKTKDFILSGLLLIPEIQTLDLVIHGTFTADGGSIIPREMQPGNVAPIQFTGTPESRFSMIAPLNINLTFSPNLIGFNMVPLAIVTPTLASPNLFVKENRFGLIWSDLEFNPSTNVWYINNIRPSEDFYAFSAAREASNWLRQQHIWNLQKHSNILLFAEKGGLWIDTQGGYERLDTSIGKEAKMPWIMASMGYDYLQHLPNIKMKALYGFAFGVSKGKNTWRSFNTTKNTINIGMANLYLGFVHDIGLYSTITAQIASSRIHTNCSGFYKGYKWEEITPTEAIELGWLYSFNNGFKINPRGQLILEHSSKHRFSLPYKDDNAILDKSTLVTSVIGVAGEYTFQARIPLTIQASLDRIKGQSGNFAVKSKILKMKFKHDNDTSVLRATLGINALLTEHVELHCNIFGDKGNDKGLGGQIGITYQF